MARNFNGGNNRIDITNTPAGKLGSKVMTVSVWVYPTALPIALGYAGLVSPQVGAAYIIYLKGNGKLAFFPGYDGTGATTLAVNNWYHIAVSIGGVSADQKYWVNGRIDGLSSSQAFADAGTVLTFGTDWNSAARAYSGNMADVAIWNDANLSPGEIQSLYSGIRPNKIRPRNLAGYWPLYGDQSPEPDLSQFRRPGVLTGPSVFALDPPQLQRSVQEILYFPPEGEMPALSIAPSFISGWSRQSNLPVIGGGTF